MGATESSANKQRMPLLPEPTPMAGRSRKASKPRNGPAVGTLLGAGATNLTKVASRKMEINLPEVDLGVYGYSTDSDGSTTATATRRSLDYDSDGNYPTEASPSVPNHLNSEVRVVIIDWDDTLLPTSFLRDAVKIYPAFRPNVNRRVAQRPGVKPRNSGNAMGGLGTGFPCQTALETHAELVREVLRTARSMAHVGIVTLAERPWVHESAEQYLPSLRLPQLLEELDIPVYYAVDYRNGADDIPGAVSKRLAMEDFLRSISGESSRLNVLSVGDSWAEREAARTAMQSVERQAYAANLPMPSCKTLKLQTDPGLKTLTTELRALLNRFGRLIALEEGVDVVFEQSDTADDFEDKLLASVGS
mmetsp:Transcript_909/g.1786  ORF Transcript_909/g.1786 Transcript_909/m.1786 type:complete len:362 (-) Transcript_909:191-1276(-)|eukprot:CAMPEP_0197649284 /NCGR_PEP_ID=MMETSP1338-20131121/28262_1 /TAXON_ID=43686 ORGANISM="Pelagodinium beii, Strain RCC1491" /NCGR_SAMPLE_ID=MMETSP1338 /ASSEMBLY_ACC=CAM_ASM_000754 /LENGTH=361 /DNA_ID=CAMNT_0043223435 /DNA_START=56 /DNA_END=1141 /DNA_ORIENTATION=-